MDLNLLPQFVAVAEAKSFSSAAVQLGVRRSSVSRAVAGLERALGVQLFSRTTRRVSLTTAGAALYAQVGPRLAALTEALAELPERDAEPSGVVRLTAPNDLGAFVLPPVLAGFARRCPGVRMDVRLTNQPVDVVAEGFDAALRISTRRLTDSTLIARRLSPVALCLFASPAYLARAGTPRRLEEAADHAWVEFRDNPWPAALGKRRRPSTVVGDDILFIREAVKAGLGLGLLPTFLAQEEVRAGRLVQVLKGVTRGVGALSFVHPPGPHQPRKVTALRDFLVAHFEAHPLFGK